jgi:hypothetical protein
LTRRLAWQGGSMGFLDGLHYHAENAGTMRAHEEERPFSDFILRWWEEGDRLHEDPSPLVSGRAEMWGEAVRTESSPIWLLAVWASLVSLLVLSTL